MVLKHKCARALDQTWLWVGILTQGHRMGRQSGQLEIGDLSSSSRSDLNQLCYLGKTFPLWASFPSIMWRPDYVVSRIPSSLPSMLRSWQGLMLASIQGPSLQVQSFK